MLKKLQIFFVILLVAFTTNALAANPTLLNVSYDPTREFYNAYNKLFIPYWKQLTRQDIKIAQSHGGSGTQARSIIEGLHADVATLALSYDIDKVAERTDLLGKDWQSKLPNNSCPYNSIIVFLVRKGNPKHIKDWNDLVRDDVQIITPNPKTSGGARWNYLAAWGYAYKSNNNSEAAAEDFITKLYKHAPILDTGARGATTNFTRRDIGDVLITWENEALFIVHRNEGEQFEIVTPSISVLAEPAVAVIEKNAKKDKVDQIAPEYLAHLYSKEAQDLIAQYYYRPYDAEIAAKYSANFPNIPLFKVSDFGGWKAFTEKHFADGGIFDRIYTPAEKN